MSKRVNFTWLVLAVMAAGTATAQTVTGSGASGVIPVFTGNSTIGNSAIYQNSSGDVGIGTTSPSSILTVLGSNSSYLQSFFLQNTYSGGGELAVLNFASPLAEAAAGDTLVYNSVGNLLISPNASGKSLEFVGGYWNNPVSMIINGSGNVGIGTTTPGAKLEVDGSLKLTSGSNGSITFQDGTTQSTAFIPANCGADFAESVGVTGNRPSYEPGDLMVIDPNAPGKFLKSSQAYSTLVAGIYSTKPGFVARFAPADPKAKEPEVPMAMVGRVPTKVSAENGPIKVGDLLVTSSTPGYAMKGTDRSQMLGAVVGKALGSLDSGTGTILVLVTLQ